MPPRTSKVWKAVKVGFIFSAGVVTTWGSFCLCSTYPPFYDYVVLPIMHRLNPEIAHRISIRVLSDIVIPPELYDDPAILNTTVKHVRFDNPIGLAAGFDKNGEAINNLGLMGFGFVEVGTVTPEPQSGNEKPRIFRLTEDKAIINRYGFNSYGMKEVHYTLKKVSTNGRIYSVVGVNLGVNKNTTDPVNDYIRGIRRFAELSDYLVINVSSPNTPGLRDLQQKQQLEKLLTAAIQTRDRLTKNPRPLLFLKLSPDLTTEEKKDIASVIMQPEYSVDGLIISNTTIERGLDLKSEHRNESGGLSGLPIKKKSTEMIEEMYKLTKGSVPIIGVGGVFTGEDAFEKIKAGASLVQIYTSFIYHGPHVITKIKKELEACLRKENFHSIEEAVGSGVKL